MRCCVRSSIARDLTSATIYWLVMCDRA